MHVAPGWAISRKAADTGEHTGTTTSQKQKLQRTALQKVHNCKRGHAGTSSALSRSSVHPEPSHDHEDKSYDSSKVPRMERVRHRSPGDDAKEMEPQDKEDGFQRRRLTPFVLGFGKRTERTPCVPLGLFVLGKCLKESTNVATRHAR